MIEGLYELNKKEIHSLYQDMSESFEDDDLYQTVFTNDEKRRSIMDRFFRYYLKAMKNCSYFYGDSDDLNAVMVIYDDRKTSQYRYYFDFILMNLKLPMFLKDMHSLDEISHTLKCYGMFTSAWVKDFENRPYLHLDLIYTKKDKRNSGLSAKLIRQLVDYAKGKELDITVETHNAHNVSFYEHFGFKLMKTIKQDDYEIEQFCMMKKWEDEVDVKVSSSKILARL